MLHLARHKFAPSESGHWGFTLVEVLVATALLGLLAGSAIWTLTQANGYAAVSRLRTGAENAAQNQIDFVMADGPFNPPTDLGSLPVAPDTTPPAWTMGQSPAKNVTIYTEPPGADGRTHSVIGQLVTTVAKCNLAPINGTDLNVFSATVVVTYTYRNKQYRVQLNAMRSPDV